MIPFKNRKIDYNKTVDIYRNLSGDAKHKYSVRQRGLVVAHTNQIMLKDCQFVVSKAGQKRVRKEKKKYVHAYVRGIIISGTAASLRHQIRYNPYTDKGFMCQNVAQPFMVKGAVLVVLNGKGVSASDLSW